jgi:glycosyltransferase involved in cell wall biosynthesis
VTRAEAGEIRVLYVNHTGTVSGAERSLLTLVEHLPEHVSATVAAPHGALTEELARAGIHTTQIRGTDGSLALHPLRTPQAVGEMGLAATQVARAALRARADLVHANTIRAGLVCVAARALGGPPVVVHVRDCLPQRGSAAAVQRTLGRRAGIVIANSRHTARRFEEAAGRAAHVVHNPVDLARFDPAAHPARAARARLGVAPGDLVFAVVAQITPWKGQDVAIRALAAARRHHPRARLLLAGSAKFTSRSARYDNEAYLSDLRRLTESLELTGAVRFLGERDDVQDLLAATDVLLAPSWEEPFGRSIVEAMAMGVPVLATAAGGPSEIVRHGGDGLLLSPRDVGAWEAAAARMAAEPATRASMARSARVRARRFGVSQHVAGVLGAYAALPAGTRDAAWAAGVPVST